MDLLTREEFFKDNQEENLGKSDTLKYKSEMTEIFEQVLNIIDNSKITLSGPVDSDFVNLLNLLDEGKKIKNNK